MLTQDFLFKPVSTIKGVGESYKKYLLKLNIEKVIDLYFHLPSGLLKRRKNPGLTDIQDGEYVTIKLVVDNHLEPHRSVRNKVPYRVSCHNDTGFVDLVFFNAYPEFIKRNLPEGETRIVSGKAEFFNGKMQISHPEYITTLEKENTVPFLEPLYPLTSGITQKNLRKIIVNSLGNISLLPEWVSQNIIKKYSFLNWADSVKNLHIPQSEDLEKYRKRLAFDEILAMQIFLEICRAKIKKVKIDKINLSHAIINEFISELPFDLTNSQRQVFEEIKKDYSSGNKMLRLIQGDVGSGKTVVAAMAALPIFSAGKQVALMAPTEILANQHYKFFEKYFSKLGFNVALLTSKIKGAQRKKILQEIRDGSVNLVVGTQALFQENVEYNNLGLVIIDEQHRFGVQQRSELTNKGSAHVLMMTATPIPRTLAMTLYGDMDISTIYEKPKERIKIETRVIPALRLEEIIGAISRALQNGEKIYWICPLIDESEKTDLVAAEKRFQEFQNIFGSNVGLIHGRTKGLEREETMSKFINGEIKILVATTVIEVGVDVPDATIIIIENAERFGLSQLHQLRGRVGRGTKKSSCLLLYKEPLSELSTERLRILKNSDDGFFIAEEDLKLRGSGEITGEKQSGFQEFKLANFAVDFPMISDAKKEAEILSKKFFSQNFEDQKPVKLLLKMFGYETDKAEISA